MRLQTLMQYALQNFRKLNSLKLMFDNFLMLSQLL